MQPTITAVLGPTNTGKTHYAIERMLCYKTGVIGLPLRLLAREVYDRVCAQKGPAIVALITGEERIVPPKARYWVCTVEAMPMATGAEFLAIDEVQLCADPDRGHVFTDKLLHARGTFETIFMGAENMRGAIAALVPSAQFLKRERYSNLTYSGAKKISRMVPRSAIVSFSIDNLYGIAELLRRQKGGAAVVMGALSPRTRNAQVQMYQEGEVDYLVATDAIGMGLNLDITHVAFSALQKFDGRRMRTLMPNELAQIAGRAGRYMRDGTFGVTGEAPQIPDAVVEAITESRFTPMKKLYWRNTKLQFGSIPALLRALEQHTDDEWLTRARDSDDIIALRNLHEDAQVAARASDGASVKLLWDVCSIPDFRDVSASEHAAILQQIYCDLHEYGHLRQDWFARQVKYVDKPEGGIDILSKRLAFIRTWTYVAERKGWIEDQNHWRNVTRAVEDRLSDALHIALTQRFVDRRTSVLLRRLKQKESLVAQVNDQGEVTIEDEFVGRLEGFRFQQDPNASPDDAKTLRSASLTALQPEYHLRSERFYNAPDTEIDFTDQVGLMWGRSAVGKLIAGGDPLKPQVQAFVDEEAGSEIADKVARRLQHFIDRKIATLFEPLFNLQKDEALTGLARGFAFQIVQGFGLLDRRSVAADVTALDQEARAALRKYGMRFGQFTIYIPILLKPAATQLRLVLWSLANQFNDFAAAPPAGLVTVPVQNEAHQDYHLMAGYRPAGERAIRVDMAERLADLLRAENSRGGFEANGDMLSITGMTLEQFANLMQGLGYKAEKGERDKKPAENAASEAPTEGAGEQSAAAQEPVEATEPEKEIFYTFSWAPKPSRRPAQNEGGKKKRPQKSKAGAKPQRTNARPEKVQKIDPDNPFVAALQGFKSQ